MATAWPPANRAAGISMSAHAAFTEGGPGRALERRDWLLRLAAEHGGRVSADQVREARGVKRCRPTQPMRSFLDRLDRLHRAKLPAERPRGAYASRAVLLRRARQARDIADRLEALAA